MGAEEWDFIKEAFDSNYIAPVGPMVDAFEEEFASSVGIRHALAVSSGTAAMHLAMQILGIGPEDDVIASTLTFIGSVTPIVFQGATPVFIDSDRTSWNMDPDLLAEELEACQRSGRLPKAVIPTDLYGQCADLDRMVEICAPYGIPVVADAAEAVGAKYKLATDAVDAKRLLKAQGSRLKGQGFPEEHATLQKNSTGQAKLKAKKVEVHAGVGAKAAVFSFNGNKIITTSGGGMLVSDDEPLIERARFLSQQARDPAPHYEHSEIGHNYRMSNVLAAIGRGQLRVLDERVEAKRRIFEYYRNALSNLPGIEFMPEAPYGRSNRWLTVVLITPKAFGADRETVRLALEAENIEARPVWKPMHMQPVFRVAAQSRKLKAESRCQNTHRARVVGGEVAEDLFDRGLCLPSGTAMREQDLDRVIKVIRRCCKKS